MRFKAEVSNVLALTRLVTSVEKLSHRGILKLSREKIYLICAGESNTSGGPQVWAQINVPSLFSELKIESNSDDQIFLEFVPTALAKALKSAAGTTRLVIRLAKRQLTKVPILIFDIESVSRNGNAIQIEQEVCVKVLKPAELEEMAKEPMCPEPDVHVLLPMPSETMRGVVERMKNLGNIITIAANKQGVLRLSVQSELASAETEWRNVIHPEMDANPSQRSDDDAEEVDPAIFHSVDIEAKHLLKLLAALANGNHTIACICSGVCLISYVYIGDNREASADMGGVLTWFLSGHTQGE